MDTTNHENFEVNEDKTNEDTGDEEGKCAKQDNNMEKLDDASTANLVVMTEQNMSKHVGKPELGEVILRSFIWNIDEFNLYNEYLENKNSSVKMKSDVQDSLILFHSYF